MSEQPLELEEELDDFPYSSDVRLNWDIDMD